MLAGPPAADTPTGVDDDAGAQRRSRLTSPRILSTISSVSARSERGSPQRIPMQGATQQQQALDTCLGGYWPEPRAVHPPAVPLGTPPPSFLTGKYGFGLRISEGEPRTVEKVNELMDEHDRVLVGSVARGDKLLAVDDVMVATMAPGEMDQHIFGPFGSISTLAFGRVSADSSTQIFNIRAKRHIPIHVWQNWAQEGEVVLEPDLPSAPPPSLAHSAIDMLPVSNSVHEAPNRERDEVFSDYDVLKPMHGLEGVHTDVRTMVPGGRSRQADMVELPIPLKSRSFTSVTADDSEEIEEVSFCSVSAPSDGDDDHVSIDQPIHVDDLSGNSLHEGPKHHGEGVMWVGVTVEEDEEVEGESKFVAGAQQGKMDEYSEGGANAVAPGSPKLEIKRLLYTIIHDAMQHARTVGDMDLHRMINRVEQQVRTLEYSFVKSEEMSKQMIQQLQEQLREAQTQRMKMESDLHHKLANVRTAASLQHQQQVENLARENFSNLQTRHFLESRLGDGDKQAADLLKDLSALHHELTDVRLDRDKARAEVEMLRTQMGSNSAARSKMEDLTTGMQSLTYERDMLAVALEAAVAEKDGVQLAEAEARTSRDVASKECELLREREGALEAELAEFRDAKRSLQEEIDALRKNEVSMRRIHHDDQQRLIAQLGSLERKTGSGGGGAVGDSTSQQSGTRTPEKPSASRDSGAEEVVRLRRAVATLESKCAAHEKEAKKIKFYMSTLPLPAG